MDEQHFDREIKKQLESWEGPDFDPTALADLRYRLAAVTPVPWYVRYRTELLVASSLLLFTLFNMLWQTRVEGNRQQVLVRVMDSLKTSQQTVMHLQEQLSASKATVLDSPYTTQPATTPLNPLYSNESDALLSQLREEAAKNDQSVEVLLRQVIDFLRSEPGIEVGPRPMTTNLPLLASTTANFASAGGSDSLRATLKPVVAAADGGAGKSEEKRLSAATVRELKKHFQRGIGIRLGPVAHLSGVSYQPGPTGVSVGGGLLADWILSPSLSLETGGLYAFRNYGREDASAPELRQLPGIDESLGRLEEVDISSQMVQFPINLKWYIPLSGRTEGVVSGGYSFLLYIRQDLEYGYELDNGATDGNLSGFISTYEQSTPRFYPGTLNAALGTSTLLKNEARLEFSLYYQHGLGPMGIEQVNASSLGLRTAYWFTVR